MRFFALLLLYIIGYTSHAQYCSPATSTLAITPSTTTQFTPYYTSGIPAFSFSATAGCSYTFSTCGESTNDTYLRLYSSTFALLGQWDDQCGLQSTFTWTCPANGTYYVHLSRYVCTSLTASTRMSYVMSCPTPPCSNPIVDAGNDIIICEGASGILNGSATAGTGSGGGSGSGTLMVTISGSGWQDMVSWTLTNSTGGVIGSGGPYAFGATTNVNIATPGNGPYTFFLETQGAICDNTVNYTISCNGNSISSGVVPPCTQTTVLVASCTGTGGGGSTLPLTYSWSPATALSSTTVLNPTASPTTTTTYTLTATQGTCSSQDQVTVYVNPLPTVDAGPDVALCGGQNSTILNGSASATGGFTGDITINLFSGSNLDETTWTMTNSLGTIIGSGGPYAAGSNNTITINNPSNPPFTFNLETQGPSNSNIAGYNVLCGGLSGTSISGGLAILTGGQTISIPIAGCAGAITPTVTWSPATTLSSSNTLTTTASPTSTTTYTLSATANGCTNEDQVTVSIGTTPTVTVNNATICSGQTSTLIATPAISGGSFLWSPGGQTTNTIDVSPSSTTNYSVVYTLNGCSSLSTTGTVTVAASPTVSVPPVTFCPGETAILTAIASPAGGVFSWNPGGQTTNSITVSPTSTTNYTVDYTVPGCPSGSATGTATLANIIDWANIQWPGTSNICEGESLDIYGQVFETGLTEPLGQGAGITVDYGVFNSNTDPATWPASAWSTASYNPFSSVNPNNDEYTGTLSNLTAGTYYYAFRYTYNGCIVYGGYNAGGGGFWDGTSNINGVVTVVANSIPTFSPISAICAGDVLSPLPSISNNGIDGTWTPALNNSQTTTYTFTPNTGICATTANNTITVEGLPTAVINNTQNTTELNCSVTSISLVGSGGGTYSWNDGTSIVSTTSNLNVSNPGIYELTVTNAAGCQDVSVIQITQDTISPPLNVSGQANELNCLINTIILDANGASTYSWTNGSSIISTNSSISVSTPGTYTVTGTEPNGCTASTSLVITQNIALPVVSITNTQNTTVLNCTTTSINLTAAGGVSYEWSNGTNILATTPNLNVNLPGTYTVTVTGANGCTATQSVTITQTTVAPIVTVSNSPNTNELTCSLTSIDLQAVGGGTYSWSSGSTTLGSSATLSVSSPGTYTVTVTGANGCSSTSSTTITQDITAPNAVISSNPNTTMLSCTNAALTLTASGGVTCIWNNGTSNIGANANLNITIPGTYTATVTGTNGCTATASTTITQNNQAPVVGIAASANGVLTCSNTSIILTGSSSTGSGTATWLNGSNILSTGPITGVGNVANLSVTTPGTYTLNILETNGCLGSTTYTVTENTTAPVATATSLTNTTVLDCNNTGITLAAGGGVSSTWSIGGTPISTNNNITVTAPGTYTATVTGPNGCIDTEQINITQNIAAPVATLTNNTAATELTCLLTSIALSATGGDTYSWSNGTSIVGTSANLNVTSPGTYTVTVASASNGCTASSQIIITQNISLPPAIISSVTAELNCTTTSIILTGSGGGTYSWSNNGSNIGTQSSITVNNPGDYILTVTGSNGCTANTTSTITQNTSLPIVGITNTPATNILTCSTQSIGLTASGGVSYSWSNGTIVVGTNALLNVTIPGTYTVTVTGANGCTQTANSVISQDIVNPTASIINNSNVTELNCTQTSISLTGAGGATYSWSNGINNIGNASSLTLFTPGTYTLTVTGANGCTDTEVITITQNNTAPTAAISNGTTILDCNTTSIALTASGGQNYSWSNATGVVGTNAQLQVTTAGTYTVTVTESNGCSDTETITITSQANTIPTFTQIAPICTGDIINLPVVSNNSVNGTWSPAVNNISTTTYTFTPTPGLCANTTTMTVVVNPYPNISAQNDTICDGSVGTITTQVDLIGGSYSWMNNTNNQANLSISPSSSSSYSVIYDLAGCTDTATAEIIVHPIPIVQVQDATICEGQTGELIASANLPNGVFLWDNGSTNDTLALSPTSTTNLSVTYTINGCSSIPVTATMTVNPLPVISINNQTICSGDPVTMQASANPTGTYFWGTNAIQGNSTYTFTPIQDTIIEVFNVLNGCSSDTLAATVTVLPLPVSTFSANVQQGCAPLSVDFTADVLSNTSYTWQTSNQLNASGAQTSLDFQVNGSYAITLTATLNGCSTSTTVANMIEVDNYPIAAFESSAEVFTQPNQQLSFWNNSIGASTYLWNFGEGGTSTEEGPTYIFNLENEGTTVTLYAYSNLGCLDTVSIFIGFDPGLVYYIPNTFTPDGDQFNQTFLPIFTAGIDPYNFQFLIYNRWGEVVFESRDPSVGWDGSFGMQGNPCQNGTYTYLITVKLPTIDKRQTIKGHVNLIR